MTRQWTIFCVLVLLFLPFGLYAPAITGTRVWDDFFLIGQNPFYRSPVLLFEAFRHWLFLDPAAAYYRPLQNWSYFIDYYFWGQWLPGYHLHNVLLHSLAGILIWRLCRRLLADEKLTGVRWDTVSFGVAFVWLIHPAHNAAVAYISGRADSLAAVFALGGWVLYRSEFVRWNIPRLLLCALLAVGAMCSRESGLVWLGLFVLYECVIRRNRPRTTRLWTFVSSAVLIALYAILRSLPPAVAKPAVDSAFIDGLTNSFFAIGDYAILLIAPLRLSMERNLVPEIGFPLGLLAAGALFTVTCILIWRQSGPTLRLRRFGIAWFILSALPILPFTPRTAASAEHWMYIPYIGLLFAALCLAGQMRFPTRQSVTDDEPDQPRPVRIQWMIFGLALLFFWSSLLATRTVLRAADWQSHQAFIKATHAHGRSTDRFRGVMAGELSLTNQWTEAEQLMRESIDRNPGNRLLRIPLGKLLEKQERYDEALTFLDFTIEELRTLRHHHPMYTEAPIYRASVLWKTDRRQEAIDYLTRAAELWPRSWNVQAALGSKLRSAGDVAKSIQVVENYLSHAAWDLRAWESLAQLQAAQHEFEASIASWHKAVRLDIRRVEGLLELAALYHRLNRREEMINTLDRAINRDPDHPKLLELLAALQKIDPVNAR